MSELPKTIKISELPEVSSINDSDIFIVEDGSVTHKVMGKDLIAYIQNHPDISDYYLPQSSVNEENGVAPIDEDRKLLSENIPFGTTTGTVFDGGRGKALEDSWDAHLLDTNDVHGANTYTDNKIAELINGTLKEISDAMDENQEAVNVLEVTIGNKANSTDLTEHIENTDIHHTHDNKDILDTITQEKIDAWDSISGDVIDTETLGGETAEEWQNKIDAIIDGTTPVAKAIDADALGGKSASEYASATHSHSKADIGLGNVDNTADADKSVKYAETAGSATPTAHNQAASTITAGTLSGKVVANATAVATLGNKQVRNIYAGTDSMTSGTTALPTGDIYIKYK